MELYRRIRPTNWEDFIGNRDVVESLRADMGRPKSEQPHAFLFIGPRGCGKTTLGRLIAQELGAYNPDAKNNPDYREHDSAQYTGVDKIREIRDGSRFKPFDSPCRVYLLDEAHRMSGSAQDALLKALEGGSDHVYYILCTTEPNKLLKTLIDRCRQHEVRPLEEKETRKLLIQATHSLENSPEIPEDVISYISEESGGQPRTALQMLDQVVGVKPDRMLEAITLAETEEVEAHKLCQLLIAKKPWKSVAEVLRGLEKAKVDVEKVRRHMLGYAKTILIKKDHPQANIVIEEFSENFFDSGIPGLVNACYRSIKS